MNPLIPYLPPSCEISNALMDENGIELEDENGEVIEES